MTFFTIRAVGAAALVAAALVLGEAAGVVPCPSGVAVADGNCSNTTVCAPEGGVCVVCDTGHVCACFPGYRGPRCGDLPPCAEVTCPPHAGCDGGSGQCVCLEGYTGQPCAAAVCEDAPEGCGPHGFCPALDAACVCAAGWSGATCAMPRCKHGGVLNVTTYACGCAPPHEGLTCEACPPLLTGDFCNETVSLCKDVACGEHGACNPDDGECRCSAGWTDGLDGACTARVCNAARAGAWDAVEVACACVEPYSGPDCSSECAAPA